MSETARDLILTRSDMQRMVDVELKKQLKEELRKMARNIIAPGVRQQCKEGC